MMPSEDNPFLDDSFQCNEDSDYSGPEDVLIFSRDPLPMSTAALEKPFAPRASTNPFKIRRDDRVSLAAASTSQSASTSRAADAESMSQAVSKDKGKGKATSNPQAALASVAANASRKSASLGQCVITKINVECLICPRCCTIQSLFCSR